MKATIDVPWAGEINFHSTQLDHLDENWRMKQVNAIIRSNDPPHILAGGLNSLCGADYSSERWRDIVKVTFSPLLRVCLIYSFQIMVWSNQKEAFFFFYSYPNHGLRLRIMLKCYSCRNELKVSLHPSNHDLSFLNANLPNQTYTYIKFSFFSLL